MGRETKKRRVFSMPLEASRGMEWYDDADFTHASPVWGQALPGIKAGS